MKGWGKTVEEWSDERKCFSPLCGGVALVLYGYLTKPSSERFPPGNEHQRMLTWGSLS